MKAMILAAGLGTRLRPLTRALPKPLLPVALAPLLRYHLEMLKEAGIRDVVLNVHHLPGAIPAALGDGSREGLHITYSYEPVILGTGGGLKAVEHLLRASDEPVVVLNGDLMIEISLRDVLSTHRQMKATATLVLREDPNQARYGAIGVGATSEVLDFVGRARVEGEVVRSGLFTGIHILEPEVFDFLPEDGCINQITYPALLRKGRKVVAHFQKGYWSDVGTPERYLDANFAAISGDVTLPGGSALDRAAFALSNEGASGSRVDVRLLDDVVLKPPVLLGEGAVLKAGSKVGPYAVVGAGATIGERTEVAYSVLWPDIEIPSGLRLSGEVIWREEGETKALPVVSE